MRTRALWPLVLWIVFFVVILNATVYTVDQDQRAIMTSFGRVVRSPIKPGIHWKIPFVDTIHIFDARLLNLRVKPKLLFTRTGRPLLLQTYVKWRITHLRRYLTTVGGSEHTAKSRIRQLVTSALRQTFGQRTLENILNAHVSPALTADVNAEVNRYGLQVTDVRIQRIGFKKNVQSAIYEHMERECMKQAISIEAAGTADAQVVRARADHKRAKILAQAYVKAEMIRGKGDAQAAALYNAAYSEHPRFFTFYRSLRAYVKSFTHKNAFLVLGPKSGFLKYLPGNDR